MPLSFSTEFCREKISKREEYLVISDEKRIFETSFDIRGNGTLKNNKVED